MKRKRGRGDKLPLQVSLHLTSLTQITRKTGRESVEFTLVEETRFNRHGLFYKGGLRHRESLEEIPSSNRYANYMEV